MASRVYDEEGWSPKAAYFKGNGPIMGPDPTLPWVGWQRPGWCGDFCQGYGCTLKKGHGGLHRGGISEDRWTAEWSWYPQAMEYPEGI